MAIHPYLMFNGRCEEAIEFYKKAVGAEVTMLMRFSENPAKMPPGKLPAGFENKIMHAELKIGDATIMGSDGMSQDKAAYQGISLALTASDVDEAERLFDGLSDGGDVRQPLTETFFSPGFGMVDDRFGVSWMVVTDQQEEQLSAAAP